MSAPDQVWMIACVIFVFFMQAGFMCVEAGITRSKNDINVAMKNLSDFSLSVLLYWLVGFGLMYGATHSGLIGSPQFAPDSFDTSDGSIRFLFQAMFCGTAATILSGAVAERCTFRGYLVITAITATLIYPVFGHWAWATDPAGTKVGWLGALGFHDFAGAGVVHALGGGVALAATVVIGPRDGRFLTTGQPRRFNGSNLPLSMLGVFLLWFGWFGFNGGSAFGFDERVPSILLNTVIGGAAGVLAGIAVSWARDGKPSVFYGMTGALGGLVAVTAACDLLTVREALLTGCVGGTVVYVADKLLEARRIDDAVGAVPVHLFAGAWGLLAVALFGGGDLERGLSMAGQLGVQALGVLAILGYCLVLPYGVLRVIDRLIELRVSHHIETIGLNVGEHGANTDLNELFEVMQRQARERDLSIRVPQSPFTEVGQIGLFYNSVMYELERSFQRVQRQEQELLQAINAKDALLESILPKSVAMRMHGGENQIVDQFTDATVVFVDIVDFTTFSMGAPPQASMDLLKSLFDQYDSVIKRYELEKIKTIGDCYMYVSGVPAGSPEHCEIAVDAALDLLFGTKQVSINLGHEIQVRIGVHSGPLIAGVVGELRFVYDLWGSTVNIAARIQEAAMPGKVTVSQAVIDRIGSQFVHQRQGRVRLRGVGPTLLYSIEGRRARSGHR